MHECPDCGRICYCDLEDSPSMTDEWVDENCVHECEPEDDEDCESDYHDEPERPNDAR